MPKPIRIYEARARSTDVAYVTGAKPAKFAYWLFDLLGLRPGDRLDDLYPGSGGITRAWAIYTAREASPEYSTDPSTRLGTDPSTVPDDPSTRSTRDRTPT